MTSRFARYPFLTLCTFVALCVLLGLSVWQFKRLAWKEALIARMEEQMAAAPLLPKSKAELLALPEFHRVKLTGTFRYGGTLLHQARYYKGNLGFHLITPFTLASGETILINRGWVPKDFRTNPKAEPENPQGQVTLIGITRKSELPSYFFLPQNDPAKDFWLWQDVEGWAAKAGALPVLVQETHEAPDTIFPITLEAHFEVMNDHLQYAITWAILAGILCVMYWIYTGKKR